MRKEKLKTLILVLLIVNSLFLTRQIWFSKKLWSQDYNFFVRWQNLKWVQALSKNFSLINTDNENGFRTNEYLFRPRRMVVNRGDYRNLYRDGDQQYAKLTNEIKNVFGLLFREDQIRYKASTEEEWFSALKGKSFYIDFGIGYNTKVLSQILIYKDSSIASQIGSIKEFIIVPGDSVTNDIMFYIKNFKDNTITKFYMNFDKAKLINIIEEYVTEDNSDYTFSFEQGFYKINPEGKLAQKFLLDPEIPIPVGFGDQNIKKINSINPFNINKLENIVESFRYNPNTIRKYTEADNTVVYVENYSTLKIHPDGLIEYKVTDETKGLHLPVGASDNLSAAPTIQPSVNEKSIPTLYETLDRVIAFVNNVWSIDDDLLITSNVIEDQSKPGYYKFEFDYYYNGMPVIINYMDEDDQQEPLYHAIQVEVQNGVIKSYRHVIREYEEISNANKEITPMFMALDNIYRSVGSEQSEIKLENVFLGYWQEADSTELVPKWSVQIGDKFFTDTDIRK